MSGLQISKRTLQLAITVQCTDSDTLQKRECMKAICCSNINTQCGLWVHATPLRPQRDWQLQETSRELQSCLSSFHARAEHMRSKLQSHKQFPASQSISASDSF